jgi:hypothetical protein
VDVPSQLAMDTAARRVASCTSSVIDPVDILTGCLGGSVSWTTISQPRVLAALLGREQRINMVNLMTYHLRVLAHSSLRRNLSGEKPSKDSINEKRKVFRVRKNMAVSLLTRRSNAHHLNFVAAFDLKVLLTLIEQNFYKLPHFPRFQEWYWFFSSPHR